MEPGFWMPTLETERLTIRAYALDDLPNVTQFDELERRREWLAWTVANYRQLALLWQPPYGDRAIVLSATGEIVGGIGYVQSWGPFHVLPSLHRGGTDLHSAVNSPELGLFWAVAPAHQNKGYTTEAGQALVADAFGRLNARRLVATTEHDNFASQAVMRKLGMTIAMNPFPEPNWFQTIGVLHNSKG